MPVKTVMTFFLPALALLLFVPVSAGAAEDDDTETSSEKPTMSFEDLLKKKKVRKVVPDPEIRAHFRKSLSVVKTVRPRAIQVRIEKGDVVLRGKVASLAERNLVDAMARTTPGVRSVRNMLRVEKPRKNIWPRGDPRGIADILHDGKLLVAVRRKLAGSRLVRMADLDIQVHMGIVIIAGPIKSDEIGRNIRSLVLFIPKVRGVINNTWTSE